MAPILMQAKRAADGIVTVFFGKGADAIRLPPLPLEPSPVP